MVTWIGGRTTSALEFIQTWNPTSVTSVSGPLFLYSSGSLTQMGGDEDLVDDPMTPDDIKPSQDNLYLRVQYSRDGGGGSGFRDRTLAVAKNRAKMTFFSRGKKNYLKKIFFFAYIF